MAINIIWLAIDKTPPAWDQAAHIRSTVLVSNYFAGTFWGGLVDLIRSFGGYPPLIYFLGGAWASVLGVGVMQISFLNTIFLVLAIWGVYKLSKEKLLAAVIFSLMPVIYDISRNFLLDLPLTVFVVWGLYFWIKSEDLKKDKYSLGLLLMLVFASLTKLNGFIYFLPIGLWIVLNNYKKIDVWMRLIIGGAIYLVAVGWWWGINFQNIYQYLTGLAGQGEKLTDPMNLLDWVTWIHYFRLFFLHQAGPILAVVAVISWFKIPKTAENKKLIWWAVVVYVIFTIIKNKDFRFTMPLLPLVAVWLGEWLSSLRGARDQATKQSLGDCFRDKPFAMTMVGLLFGWLLFNYVENSFGWPVKKPVLVVTPTFLIGDIEWIGWDDYPVQAASGVEWPNKRIIKEMILAKNDDKSTVLVLIDSEQINDNNLKLYREMVTNSGDRVLEMHSVYQPYFDGWNNFDAVLVGERTVDPAPFYATNLEYLKQARDFVWDNSERFEQVTEYDLPNKQKLFLMRIL